MKLSITHVPVDCLLVSVFKYFFSSLVKEYSTWSANFIFICDGCCWDKDDSLTVSINSTSSTLYVAAPLYSSSSNASSISARIMSCASFSDVASITRESNNESFVFIFPCWWPAAYVYTLPFFEVNVIDLLIWAVMWYFLGSFLSSYFFNLDSKSLASLIKAFPFFVIRFFLPNPDKSRCFSKLSFFVLI